MSNSLLDTFLKKLNNRTLLFVPEYHNEIFHYTSINNISSILMNTSDKIVLWSSRYDCLNDASEGTIVEKRYHEVCDKLKSSKKITDEMYNLFHKIVPTRNENFIIYNERIRKTIRCEYTTFITSFSKKYDLLPMWNYYSKENKYNGINIGMSPDKIKEDISKAYSNKGISISIAPIIYDISKQRKMIKNFLLDINQVYEKEDDDTSVRAIISMKLTSLKMIFKEECFKHEEEVRVIINVANKYLNDITINYRTHMGITIPYIELQIDKLLLNSVTLGPSQEQNEQKVIQKNDLSNMLNSHNYHAITRDSTIPVRY